MWGYYRRRTTPAAGARPFRPGVSTTSNVSQVGPPAAVHTTLRGDLAEARFAVYGKRTWINMYRSYSIFFLFSSAVRFSVRRVATLPTFSSPTTAGNMLASHLQRAAGEWESNRTLCCCGLWVVLCRPSQLRGPTPKASQSISALKESHFRPAYKNHLNFGHRTTNESIPILQQKRSQFRFPTQKSSSFRPTTEITPILIPTLNSSKFLCLDTKTKFVSIRTLKPSYFRPPQKQRQFRHLRWNQVQFDPSYSNQVNFDHQYNSLVKFDAPHRCPHRNQFIFNPSLKSSTHFNIKSISMPPYENWVDINPYTKNQ